MCTLRRMTSFEKFVSFFPPLRGWNKSRRTGRVNVIGVLVDRLGSPAPKRWRSTLSLKVHLSRVRDK